MPQRIMATRNFPNDSSSPPRPSVGSKDRSPAPLPAFVEPQLATLVTHVPEDSGWLHELKFDGYRLLCRIDRDRVTFLTRNAQDWTARFAELAQAARQLPARQAIIDGEIIALEEDGSHNFQRLQNSFRAGGLRLLYYAFDLLYRDGRDLRAAPLLERKALLQRLVAHRGKASIDERIRYSEHWIGGAKKLLDEACKAGLEGIVAKRIDEPYRSGRGRSWLKIKCVRRQEFVIGGFTDPAGARAGFGALLGVHDANGALRYAGKVGTGFDDQTLHDLHCLLRKHERPSMPFTQRPGSGRLRGVHWVEPSLVGEVAFTGWTSDGLLRHPSFHGLREDKSPGEIIRETAEPAPRKVSREGAPRRRRRNH
jgi:bifunctional non-homologous end joining protein LigD